MYTVDRKNKLSKNSTTMHTFYYALANNALATVDSNKSLLTFLMLVYFTYVYMRINESSLTGSDYDLLYFLYIALKTTQENCLKDC